MQSKKISENINPWLGSLVIFPAAVYYTINAGKFTFIDYLNLLIHEGGHGVFSLFGKFIYTLGGSLIQIIIPSMFVVFYWIKKKRFLTQIFLIWLGENLMNISVYISDARARRLPLLGGNKVYHDWNYLLSRLGILDYDSLLGNIVYGIGILMFLIALLIPLFLKKYRPANIEINL